MFPSNYPPSDKITEALRRAGDDVVEAAEMIGMDPSNLRWRLRDDPDLWPRGEPRRSHRKINLTRPIPLPLHGRRRDW